MIGKIVDGYKIYYDQVVGRGAYAKVYSCQKDNIVYPLCAKEIKLQNVNAQEREIIDREIKIMKHLLQSNYNHPNIIQVFHIAEQDDCHYIIMEKCLQGHLEKTIQLSRRNKVPFTATQVIDILKQIVNGYKFLYDQNIVHRDIKPENLLMGNDGKLKIADFGMSKTLQTMERQSFQTQVGTPIYASPQVLIDGNYSSKTDVYSLGVLIYYMIYQKYPFNAQCLNGLINLLKLDFQNNRIQIPTPLPIVGTQEQLEQLKNFLKNTITYTEQDRLDWPSLFQTFLPQIAIFSKSVPQLHPQQQQVPITNSQTSFYMNRGPIENSYKVKEFLQNLESRISLAQNVLKYFTFFRSKFPTNCNQFDSDFLTTTLLGYEMLLNRNLIGLIDKNPNSICKMITQTQIESNLRLDFDEYLSDRLTKEQQERIRNQNILNPYNKAKDNLLRQLTDPNLSNFKAFLENLTLDYSIFASWFGYYFNKNFYERFRDKISGIQDLDTLMFFAYAIKLIKVEIEFPLKDYLYHNQLAIYTVEHNADALINYIKNNN